MRKPRLLFVCQSLPYPTDAGHHLRSYNILRLLARDFDVRSIFFYRRATRPTDSDVATGLEGVREFGPACAIPIPQDGNLARLGWDHLRSLVTGRVYTRYMYDSARFHQEIGRALSEHDPEIVHVDTLDLSACLPTVRHLPVVLTHHNIESRLLERRARAERSIPMRAVLSIQSRLMAREERKWAPIVDLNVVVAEGERVLLREMAPDAKVIVVPNGVDTSAFRPASAAERTGVVFVGAHSWLPNRDSMEYFGEAILPLIRAEEPDVAVTWVGPASDRVRNDVADRFGIRMTGFVDEIHPYVRGAACYVVPLRIGGGTRLKILDAWALGSAIVSTSIGCEGLDARDGVNMLVREDPTAFASAVLDVLRDPELQARLSRAGRATACRFYDWDVLGEAMLPEYHALLGGRRAGRSGGSVGGAADIGSTR